MPAVVVDTNVLVVSNGKSPQASAACVAACINALVDTVRESVVSIDSLGLILEEYANQGLSHSGQPGVGDYFFKWLFDNQWNVARCERVEITEHAARGFEEFPEVAELQAFDRSDRKFVAVALASANDPEILNAVDSDWWDFRVALAAAGVRIRFLCPDAFEA